MDRVEVDVMDSAAARGSVVITGRKRRSSSFGAGIRCVHMSSVHRANDIRVYHKECMSLVQAGFDVHLIARKESGTDHEAAAGGVNLHLLSSDVSRVDRMTRVVREVRRRALQLDGALYHFHDIELIPLGLELRARGKHVIYDVHEDVPAAISSKRYLPRITRAPIAAGAGLVEMFMARAASAIVTATPAIARRFPRDRTVVVHNFPLKRELLASERVPFRDRRQAVVYSGGISIERGILEIVRSMGLARSDARLVLLGQFDSSATATAASALDGWQRVEAHGWQARSSLPGHLAQVRAGLVIFRPEPNHVEALPNKLFEYMSAGLPVIVSDFPLWREIVKGNDCGLLVDPHDSQAIARAIDWIMTHPDEAERMGARGREAVENWYNWDREGETLVTLYQNLLSGSERCAS